MQRLDERLMAAKRRLRSKQKLESMLAETRRQFQEEQTRHATFKETVEREQADVTKLEGLSLAGLFYSVLGTKDERLEQERQEFLAARLKFDECEETLSEIQDEMRRLKDELSPLTGADEEYRQLLSEKEAFVAGAGGAASERLLDVSEEIADREAEERELAEAIRAGEAARARLREVQTMLKSAGSWGVLDMMGGGMMATMVKHSKMDAAKQSAHRAQRELRRFQEELADASERLNLSLDVGSFAKFADFFFDGLITDWVVQSRIQEASSACSSAMSRVASAVATCRRRREETLQTIETLNDRRNELIEAA
ncbi:hypothetical protein Mal4_11180 [Maioricimonas rarisocia]|uniref:Uncharacterized protein n=1 Tax=Maioricimonas rarisocia TaxID=2528026 RepID=A0A517Z2U1_9PLAN|nr:hypothetical protein [Maioricimonas rarisocia]QDU36820.1 hypothetical protein Mal4_11180 [Maioricimonas rarisocia]